MRISLDRQIEDRRLRESFELREDTTVLLPTEQGFVIQFRELTYDQAHRILETAALYGVELNRRRTR